MTYGSVGLASPSRGSKGGAATSSADDREQGEPLMSSSKPPLDVEGEQRTYLPSLRVVGGSVMLGALISAVFLLVVSVNTQQGHLTSMLFEVVAVAAAPLFEEVVNASSLAMFLGHLH